MKKSVFLVIGAGLVITTVALAQPPLANDQAPPLPLFSAAREASGEFIRCTARNALLAGVLAYAHGRLEINSAQEPAWTKFADALQQALKPVDSLCHDSAADAAVPTSLSALMERRERTGEVMMQVMKSARVAVSELESSLTAEQKQRLVEVVLTWRK